MNLAIITSKFSSALLVTLCFSFITFVTGTGGIPCDTVGCGCRFTNENGTYEISMKELKKSGKYFTAQGKPAYWTYYINPCYVVSEGGCDAAATVCQVDKSNNHYTIATVHIEGFSSFIDEKSPVTVTYKEQGTRQMKINLQYGESESLNDVLETDTQKKQTYTLTIVSPTLRPRKVSPDSGSSGGGGSISVGSVIVIIFFVLVAIYLVAGILFMKYKRGATGKEVMPNVEFWSSLPGLIKDGCVFFGKKMKGLCDRFCNRDGYSEI